ncbi:unnamed protein product [Rotaria sp. Silwood2]|nr:unnamed protein product [Rotaria sp. Silwood2]CAF3211028.1 unnamed protein product [Rotaria sp. Silwood2]CAF3251808.1 unnamed protein product [Rotaria sp. Silwood2]CAF3330155.1 unnamed protein product [Rotaria sp. Silwood2]CAF4271822.1 unnamed protein product [Rotaria sp. Silwood2]
MTDDICDALELDIDCKELDDLKEELCFEIERPKIMIKLTEDKLKEQSRRKDHRVSTTSNINLVLVTTNASPETNEVASLPTSIRVSQISLNDRKQYQLLNQWYSHNKENLKLDNVDFTDDVNYGLNMVNFNDDIDVTILYNCEKINEIVLLEPGQIPTQQTITSSITLTPKLSPNTSSSQPTTTLSLKNSAKATHVDIR